MFFPLCSFECFLNTFDYYISSAVMHFGNMLISPGRLNDGCTDLKFGGWTPWSNSFRLVYNAYTNPSSLAPEITICGDGRHKIMNEVVVSHGIPDGTPSYLLFYGTSINLSLRAFRQYIMVIGSFVHH